MSDATNQGAVLQSLKNAYDAADDGYVAALTKGASDAERTILDGARQHALLAYTSALSESLVNYSPFTASLKTQLDAATTAINNSLNTDKSVAEWITLLSNLAQLAGSVASAFA
jgi:hypothetical protein